MPKLVGNILKYGGNSISNRSATRFDISDLQNDRFKFVLGKTLVHSVYGTTLESLVQGSTNHRLKTFHLAQVLGYLKRIIGVRLQHQQMLY